jgi:hypothetical protein
MDIPSVGSEPVVSHASTAIDDEWSAITRSLDPSPEDDRDSSGGRCEDAVECPASPDRLWQR